MKIYMVIHVFKQGLGATPFRKKDEAEVFAAELAVQEYGCSAIGEVAEQFDHSSIEIVEEELR